MLQRVALAKHQSPPRPFTVNWHADSRFTPGLDGFSEWSAVVFDLRDALPILSNIRRSARNFVGFFLVDAPPPLEETPGKYANSAPQGHATEELSSLILLCTSALYLTVPVMHTHLYPTAGAGAGKMAGGAVACFEGGSGVEVGQAFLNVG